MKNLLKRFIFYSILFGIWQFLFSLEIQPEYLFPSPAQVAYSIIHGFTNDHYAQGILFSIKRLVYGYVLAVGLGLLLGALLASSTLLEETLGSLILGLQTLPSICWLPLSLLWFGLSDAAIIFVVVMGSLLSITLATQTAFKQVPVLLVQAGRTMGAKGLKLYLYVIFPASFPILFEGLKQGWSFAWRSLMGGELLFMTIGLGHFLNMGRELNDMSQVMGVMIVIIAIGISTDRLLFSIVESKIAHRWGFRKA